MGSRETDWRHAKGVFAVLLGLPLGWYIFLFAWPMAMVWALSFGADIGVASAGDSGIFANYARALQPLYLGIFGKSLLYAGVATALCLAVAFPVALAISFSPGRRKLTLLIAVMLPFWTNLLIRTYALIALLRDEGLINKGLTALFGWAGFTPLAMMNSSFAVIVGLVYVHLPFAVLPIYAALDRLDRRYLEASLDLGAGHVRTIIYIVLPLAAPGIAAAALLTFIPVLGAYLTPDLLGGPDSQMIANVIERQFKRANDWPFGAALSFMLIYLTFAAIALRSLLARGRGAAA